MERLVCGSFFVFFHLVWLPMSSAAYFSVCLESLFNVWAFGPCSRAVVIVSAVTRALRAPRSMRKGVCTTCVCVGCSLGLRGGLKWIPSCWLFHIPPARPTMPLCSCPTALWDSCYLRGRGWPPPTFSFKVRMVNSCYPVSWWLARAAESGFSSVGVKVFCCLLARLPRFSRFKDLNRTVCLRIVLVTNTLQTRKGAIRKVFWLKIKNR